MVEKLSPGDFLYQSDQELFLVVVEEEEDHFLLAAHGWRKIDKNRLEQYLEDDKSNIHKQDRVEDLIEQRGDEADQEQFDKLKKLFDVYEIEDMGGDTQEDFALEDK